MNHAKQILLNNQDIYNIMTLSNLLVALSFDVHPSNKFEWFSQMVLKLDREIYETILEEIFIIMNSELDNPGNDIPILI